MFNIRIYLAIPLYCRKPFAFFCVRLSVLKLRLYCLFNISRFKLRIYFLNRCVFPYKSFCGFLSHSRNSLDIIGTVSAKSFEVNQVYRLKSVFLFEFLNRIFNSAFSVRRFLRGKILNRGVFRNKLKTVPVTCQQYTFIARIFASLRECPKHIISFKSFQLHSFYPEIVYDFLDYFKLCKKFVRHLRPVRLVSRNRFMSESIVIYVKRYRHTIRFYIGNFSHIYVHEAFYGVCRYSFTAVHRW